MQRKSGVLMHVSSLWGDYSAGAFGDEAKEWIDFISSCRFSVWQVLPFCLTDECNSPYKSYSAFSLNPNFISLKKLYDKGLLTSEELENARQKTPYSCEFERLTNERFPLLKKAGERLKDRKEVDTFISSRPHIKKFCEFMALKTANDSKPWNEWNCAVPDNDTFEAWKFIEYEFYVQWLEIKEYANKKGISIIGDIPIYVSYDSSDVWSAPEQFLLDNDMSPTLTAGVPPDYFCEDGQLWGNPLYDWDAMEKDGYKWWRERIEFMTDLFDGVRIDHFRGLESYYTIPAGAKTAKNGTWKKGPGMKLINAVKDLCKDKLIIAEDLGDITPEVYKLVIESGFPGMRVLQFGFLSDASSPHLPHNYINNCVAYTGTHDNNTLLGYVWELDESTRKRLLEYCGFKGSDWNSCYDDILRTIFASSAGLVILPVQDLLLYGSDTRLNTPGKAFGNWSYRITKDQLKNINKDKFIKWNSLYGR